MNFRARKLVGRVELGVCRGTGAKAAKNGRGGRGKRI